MRVRYNQTTTEITLKNEQLFMNGWVKVVKKERDVGTKLFFQGFDGSFALWHGELHSAKVTSSTLDFEMTHVLRCAICVSSITN
jgi:hypothetical protein